MRTIWIACAAMLWGGHTVSHAAGKPDAARTPDVAATPSLPGAAANGEKLSYEQEIRKWHDERMSRLASDTGWLTVAGLFWLHPGENTFGTDKQNEIVLPPGSAPARAGVFVHQDSSTTIRANEGTVLRVGGKPVLEMALRSDAQGEATIVELNDLRFFVIKRGDRYAIRMRDLDSPLRKIFRGVETYPIQPSYRVTAHFEPYDPPHKLPIASIIGTVDTMPSPGALVFTLHGTECRIDPVLESPDDKQLFVIFKDETSGEETYGSGRFLYVDMPKDGRVVVDFNKAYNPPCAFTPFATCPLPPRQNVLPLAVRAGEKNYGHH